MHALELTSQAGPTDFSVYKQIEVAFGSSCILDDLSACNIKGKTNQLM